MDAFAKDELIAAAGHRFAHAYVVRFQDIDAAGIVFYPRILEYFHDAYVGFLAAHGCALDQALRTRAFIAPITHAEADFLRPLRFGDPIEIALVRARTEAHRVSIGYRVARPDGEVVAVGITVHAFLDADWNKAAPPTALREALAQLGR